MKHMATHWSPSSEIPRVPGTEQPMKGLGMQTFSRQACSMLLQRRSQYALTIVCRPVSFLLDLATYALGVQQERMFPEDVAPCSDLQVGATGVAVVHDM